MDIPLCVDLDGTLIKSDLLFETFLIFVKKNPFNILLCFFWLFRSGKAFLKQQIANRVEINPALLPYTPSLLSYLQNEKSKGRKLVLATASDMTLAKKIADYLGIFTEIIASDGYKNMRGECKRDTLNQKFGFKQYDYAGNDKDDLTIWNSAREAIIVNPSRGVLQQSKKLTTIAQIYSERRKFFKPFLKLLRVHQYAKNSLVFVPVLVGHLFNTAALVNSILAFCVFCLLASSVYLLNDLLDIEADRQHATKRNRPFAAGEISIQFGLIFSPLFFFLAYLLATLLPPIFLVTITFYYITTLLYSFYLKKKMLIDVFVLSTLFTVRIVAGVAAVNANYSPWLICFSLFLFLSLAFIKRFNELYLLDKQNKMSIIGRDYHVDDLIQMRLFGTISGYISVLVLALYINSNQVMLLYHYANLLWFICLLLLYWISRIWMLATRGEVDEDPVLFSLKDKTSWVVFAITSLLIIIATC